MNALSDQVLFHTGLIVGGVSLLLLIVFLLMMRIRSVKLKTKLDSEYGERTSNKKAK